MADNTNRQPNIEQVRDLLSPYLDGEVTDEERALVEEVVATSPELREEMETLRQTVALVTALPQVPAPRPFTLSEAGVQAASPAPRKYFGLPAWANGLVMLATVLVCVAAGGLFLWGQVSDSAFAPSAVEIARQPTVEAPAAEKAEEATQEEAPAEEPAAAEPRAEAAAPAEPSDEGVVAEEAAAESEMEMAEAEPTSTQEATEGEETLTDQAAAGDDALSRESEPEASTSRDVGETDADEIAAEKATPGTGEAAEQPPAAAPPSVPTIQPEQHLEHKEIAPRQVEIKNQQLSVNPGFIQIKGVLEATTPGSTLQATLQRNNKPFDSWADPASLQTAVQADGQFSFNIRASAAQANRDLFALEPANYQIIITSAGTDAPVMASVSFDTFGPVAATEEPTPTTAPSLAPSPGSTSSPSPTVVARLTVIPSATPTVKSTELLATLVEDASPKVALWLVGAGIAVLIGLLTIIGLVVWLIIRSQRQKP